MLRAVIAPHRLGNDAGYQFFLQRRMSFLATYCAERHEAPILRRPQLFRNHSGTVWSTRANRKWQCGRIVAKIYERLLWIVGYRHDANRFDIENVAIVLFIIISLSVVKAPHTLPRQQGSSFTYKVCIRAGRDRHEDEKRLPHISRIHPTLGQRLPMCFSFR